MSAANDESALRLFLRQLCDPDDESRRFEHVDGTAVDFERDPVERILAGYIGWLEEKVREVLRQQGYSQLEIEHFEARQETATSIAKEDTGPHCLYVLYATDPVTHRKEDMLLIDVFPLLRKIHDFADARQYLAIINEQTKVWGRALADTEPQRRGSKGGKEAARLKRKEKQRIKRVATAALRELEKKNPVKKHFMTEIEAAANLPAGTLRKKKISRRSLTPGQLRKNGEA